MELLSWISLSEVDVWEGQECNIPINDFKRISVNRDGISTPTRIV